VFLHYSTSDYPVMNIAFTYPLADSKYGVCRGTLWRTGPPLGTKRFFSSGPEKTIDYCILAGVRMHCFESAVAYERGDAPMTTVAIVGASAAAAAADGFCIVTDQGTHWSCQAPTATCRDHWLRALHAGLERAVSEPRVLMPKLTRPQPQKYTKKRSRMNPRHCLSCGAVEGGSKELIGPCTPLLQYGKESRQEVCSDCLTAQGLVDHMLFVNDCLASEQQERKALVAARELLFQCVASVSTLSADVTLTNEKLNDLADPQLAKQEIKEEGEHSSNSTGESWSNVSSDNTSSPPEGGSSPEASWTAIDGSEQSGQWVQIPATIESTKIVMDQLQNPASQLNALARTSPSLKTLANQVLDGHMSIHDFLEEIDEEVGKQSGGRMAALKKQAFRVAGDMGTAMKLLLDHALPIRDENNTVVLACVLDFFLDLCEEGELSSVAFFWQQLGHIHLRMLPPQNAADLARVELLEDFLLTVSSRYSTHLALELVWSHTADLEDSLSANPCAIECKRRRYAVLRFVCELESLLFDFDDGWGGGTVSLGKKLAPTSDQVTILKNVTKRIQELRKSSKHRLTRSARVDRLTTSRVDQPTDIAVQEKLMIARNADYFSSHLNFSKRLCDIAEKLRFMDVENRAGFLTLELDSLNSSGAMGGDPLNRVRDERVRVVRLPSTEGHVFRSKERTPVLLLVETIDDTAEEPIETDRQRSIVEVANGNKVNVDDGFNSNTTDAGLVTSDEDCDRRTRDSQHDETETLSSENSAGGKTSPLLVATPDTPSKKDNLGHSTVSLDESFTTSTSPKGKFLCCQVMMSLKWICFFSHFLLLNFAATALKRFDASDAPDQTPKTPRSDVEQLVNSVMVKKLKDLEGVTDASLDLPELLNAVTPPSTSDEISTSIELPELLKEDCLSTSESDGKVVALGTKESHNESAVASDSPKKKDDLLKKKLISLGGLASPLGEGTEGSGTVLLAGDVRRDVLHTLMMRGKEGNVIAAGTADSVQRSLKELERQRATELLMDDSDSRVDQNKSTSCTDIESTTQKLATLGIGRSHSSTPIDVSATAKPTEEDEVMESIRLLLIQNRVAQGHLSPIDAAKVLQHASIPRSGSDSRLKNRNAKGLPLDVSDCPTIDAGDIDRRLVGCGPLPPAVLQALILWKGDMVSHAELLELVKKDILFVTHSVLYDAENREKLYEDSAFWGRFAFGERWAEKKARIKSTSPVGCSPGWDLHGVIVKSNDDLRQEAFIMQLIELSGQAFELAGLELWVFPYRILATGRSAGVIEMVRNAMSFDALKKRPGYGKGGLREHLQRMTEFSADPGDSFMSAKQNFVRSLAAYSLISYLFQIKDRHNGNLLLDTAGHVIHIDFGFVFGTAPGGSFSLEMSTPFKLTEEMLEVMGGLKSPLFSDFVTLFCCGYLALQSHSSTFLTIVEIMCSGSTFNCFEGKDKDAIVSQLRERFIPDKSKEETVAFALDLIQQATTSYGTRQYDLFQYLSQGIAA
jgi:hypothetical protein